MHLKALEIKYECSYKALRSSRSMKFRIPASRRLTAACCYYVLHAVWRCVLCFARWNGTDIIYFVYTIRSSRYRVLCMSFVISRFFLHFRSLHMILMQLVVVLTHAAGHLRTYSSPTTYCCTYSVYYSSMSMVWDLFTFRVWCIFTYICSAVYCGITAAVLCTRVYHTKYMLNHKSYI